MGATERAVNRSDGGVPQGRVRDGLVTPMASPNDGLSRPQPYGRLRPRSAPSLRRHVHLQLLDTIRDLTRAAGFGELNVEAP